MTTDETMTAEVLRKAAELMRKRAMAATPGSWQAADSWAGSNAVVNGDGHPIAVCGNDSPDTQYTKASGDRSHIASWHPGVALAVVDLLMDAALTVEVMGPWNWDYPSGPMDATGSIRPEILHAFGIAGAYLGSES